ncbi:DNA cytosine methyltransferase [Microbulbifer sp. TYP-18]|uniref:DNA cytosine methyltransferase n=1 Tax=Microbulbifer sp. TYP-18 TaxID=3230024 RepID=UPI0034C5CBE7
MGFEFHDELIVDNFAGGGGASEGIEQGFGRPVDIAINHDSEAIAMHQANHPHTRHYCESVWDVDPRKVTRGRPVGLAWFSPDCKHFSKAKGGRPVEKKIRGLAWVAIRWAATVRPRVIMLENVEEFQTWGPLDTAGRPCKERRGQTFQQWRQQLIDLGYQVEHRELRACDYGAPTSRKRLFLIARCDGRPIVWPEPTHGEGLIPYRTAAECIDWSIPCPSIFERKRPLAENTLRRIARGIQRFVIDNPAPFIVRLGHTGWGRDGMQYRLNEPLTTITSKQEHCLVAPYIQPYYGDKGGRARGRTMDQPLATQTTENRFALCAAFLAKHYGGNYTGPGCDLQQPISTVTATDHHALVTSHLLKLRNNCDGQDLREPMHTVTTGGHFGEVRAFLVKYFGTAVGANLNDPLHTVTSKARFGLVTVHGEPYRIVDIGMRMLAPRELYRAQGFPEDYIIDATHEGKPLSKTAQTRMCGNSVSPAVARALVRANCGVTVPEQERSVA